MRVDINQLLAIIYNYLNANHIAYYIFFRIFIPSCIKLYTQLHFKWELSARIWINYNRLSNLGLMDCSIVLGNYNVQ